MAFLAGSADLLTFDLERSAVRFLGSTSYSPTGHLVISVQSTYEAEFRRVAAPVDDTVARTTGCFPSCGKRRTRRRIPVSNTYAACADARFIVLPLVPLRFFPTVIVAACVCLHRHPDLGSECDHASK